MEAKVVPVLFGIPLGLIPAMIARSKGESFVVGWVYENSLFILALVHALLRVAIREEVYCRGGTANAG